MPNHAKKTAHAGVGAARARRERAAARTDAIVTNAAHDAITAERSLRAEVKERQEPPARGKGLHSRMTVRDAAAVWLARMEASDRSAKTKRVYRDAVAGCLLPADIANLTLSEANRVATVAAYLQDVSSAHGGGAAKQ